MKRIGSEGAIPLIDVEGDAASCGKMLGETWREALQRFAGKPTVDHPRVLRDRLLLKLFSRHAPYLIDLFQGMCKGAGIAETNLTSWQSNLQGDGCTSFAVLPSATLDGIPISGQTKDTPADRIMRYRVLRMKVKGAPSTLTVTYPGELFGHGFVTSGCSIFRNSLYAGHHDGVLPYDVWGLLALHQSSVEAVKEFTKKYPPAIACHVTVADEHGGIMGIEVGKGALAFLKPKRGIYSHANHVESNAKMRKHEADDIHEKTDASPHRKSRMQLRLEETRGHITAQTAYHAMCDLDGYPKSVCSDKRSVFGMTTSAIVVEPTKGRLHATRGLPTQNWPTTYSL